MVDSNSVQMGNGLGPWRVEAVRLTAFGPPEIGGVRWEQMGGGQPQVSAQHGGIQIESGSREGFMLQLQRQSGRVDWQLLQVPGANGPTFPTHPDPVMTIVDWGDAWLASGSAAPYRLALGVSLLQQVESASDGYTRLDSILHAVQVSPATSDFVYRINRPTSLEGGLSVNRLSTWTVVELHRLQVAAPLATGLANPVSIRSGPTESLGHFVKCELDINTDAMRDSPLPPDAELLNGFAGIVSEIAETGDRYAMEQSR